MNQPLRCISISLKLTGSSAHLAFVCQDPNLWTEPHKKLHGTEFEMVVHFEKVTSTPNMTEYQYNPPNTIAAFMQ